MNAVLILATGQSVSGGTDLAQCLWLKFDETGSKTSCSFELAMAS